MYIGVGTSADTGYIGANEKTGHGAYMSPESNDYIGGTTTSNSSSFGSNIKMFGIIGIVTLLIGGFLVYKFA